MAKYRNGNVEVEAWQMKSDFRSREPIPDWLDRREAFWPHVNSLRFESSTSVPHVVTIKTADGDTNLLYLDDWLILDGRGNFHSCNPDIFDATYELVQDTHP